jgi:hypothetical protein
MDGGRKVTMDEVLKLGAHPALKCGPWISWSINGENNQVCLLYVVLCQSSQISVIQPALFDSHCISLSGSAITKWKGTRRNGWRIAWLRARTYIRLCIS